MNFKIRLRIIFRKRKMQSPPWGFYQSGITDCKTYRDVWVGYEIPFIDFRIVIKRAWNDHDAVLFRRLVAE